MVSRRYRATNTLGTRIDDLDSRVSKVAQRSKNAKSDEVVSGAIEENAVSSREIAPNAVDQSHITPGAVGTRELGVVNEVTSDGTLNLISPNGKFLVNGSARLSGYAQGGGAIPTDWNNALESGWYTAQAAANAPNSNWLLGYVEAHNSSYVTQTVHEFTSDTEGNTKVWRRARNAGTWTSWYAVKMSQTEIQAMIDSSISAAAPGYSSETIAGLVERATQAEAEAGSDNARYMSPLRTAQAIAATDALACKVTKSSAQSAPAGNAQAAILWNTEKFDPFGMHSTSSNTSRINIPRSGIWYVGASVRIFANTQYSGIQLAVNGTPDQSSIDTYDGMTTNNQWPQGNGLIQLSSGDYIEILFRCAAGSAALIVANCWFEAIWMGA